MKTNNINFTTLDNSAKKIIDLNFENSRTAFLEDAIDEYEYLFVA